MCSIIGKEGEGGREGGREEGREGGRKSEREKVIGIYE